MCAETTDNVSFRASFGKLVQRFEAKAAAAETAETAGEALD
jgi:hypothetical protein